MIYMNIKDMEQMVNKWRNNWKKMNYKNLWKRVKIHNGGEILQMN